MSKKNLFLKSALAVSVTAGLAACGGGGSSSDGTKTQGPETGRFVDSEVSGLEFESIPSGLSGTTSKDGEFTYREGDVVTFTLGALYFGKVAAKNVLNPLDLTSDDQTKATRIAQVLQTLDDDGTPGNGITISEKVRIEASTQPDIDVATTPLSGDTETQILSLAAIKTIPSKTLVPADEAFAHLNETLKVENKVTSCSGDGTSTITEADLAGKTFGFTRSETDDNEVVLFKFASDGGLEEFQNDNGSVQYKPNGTWSISGPNLVFNGEESFAGCVTDDYLIFESADGTTFLYEAEPFTKPGTTQSYVLTVNSTPAEILSISPELSVNFLTDGNFDPATASTAVIAGTGELNVPDYDTSSDSLYLLAAQGKRAGIYLDFNDLGNLTGVNPATIIAPATPVTDTALAEKVFVDHDKEANETIIVSFQGTTMFDYHNDSYDGSTQVARVSESTWAVENGGYLTLDGITKSARAFDSGLNLYLKHDNENPVHSLTKTQAIVSDSFLGTYNVNVPTENTVNNELVISNDSNCSYSGTACTWTIDPTSGKVTLNFGADKTGTASIWQLAGSSDNFAFLITHSNDATDIEVGYMTRK